ncbi:Tyrosinase [Paramuricea clavata]|uniref:Tyrosinase n=2 Tax=Paramuricea clavata TaxID=317549 RepID=A0A6S7I8G6_PARCT|nr:Tyrosinase [Paramuricea clavata]
MRLTKEERRQYIYAVKAVRSDPRTSKKFYDLAAFHQLHFCVEIHCKVNFLPWHRWYILQYENLLREIVPNVTLVYWDWSAVMANPFDNDIWDDNDWSFGGNGNGVNNTVIAGPFKEPEWKMVPGDGPFGDLQLRRDLGYSYPYAGIPSALHLAIMLKLKPDDLHKMLAVLIGYHNNIHGRAFGPNSTMSFIYSIWAPEFFLHHTFLDKYWSEWQEQGYEYKYTAYYVNQTRYMLGTHYLPNDFMDLKYQEGNVCVTYEDSTEEWIHKKLRSLTLDQLRSIRGLQFPAFVTIIKYKSISKVISERDTPFLSGISDLVKEIILRNPITLEELSGVDRIRGFRLHDLLEM